MEARGRRRAEVVGLLFWTKMKDDKTDNQPEWKELLSRGLKRCSLCKQVKRRSEYNTKIKGTNKIKCYCKDCGKIKSRKYHNENKDKHRQYMKEYMKKHYKKSAFFRFKLGLRNCINQSLRNKGYRKKSRAHEILGCSYDELLVHLYLTSSVNPISHPNETLHLDHIVPMASAKDEQEAVALNHYTNLQWLTATDNYKKGAKTI